MANIKGVHLLIEPTDFCNARCIMCDQSRRENMHNIPKGFMDLNLFRRIINDVKKFPIPIDAIDPLWAGESLLHPEFKNMLWTLFNENKRHKIFRGMVLNTNGTLFDEGYTEIFVDYASWIEREHLDKEGFFLHLYFSLEAVTAKTFSLIKNLPPALFTKTIENILYLIKRKSDERLTLPHLILGFIVMKENINEVKEFVSFWSKIFKKFKMKFEIVNYFPHTVERDSIYIRKLISSNPEESISLFKKASLKLGLEYREEKNTKSDKNFRRPCGAAWKTPNIAHDGTVVPCCRDLNFALRLGNIKEKSLTELWFGEKITRLRIAHVIGNLDKFPMCRDCIEPESYISDEEIISYLRDINREDLIEIYLKRKEAFEKRDAGLLSLYSENKKETFNICLVSREFPPETDWGGIGRYTYLLAKGLVERGHNVHVVTQTFQDEEYEYIENGVYVHRIKHPEIFKVKIPLEEFARRLEYSWRVYRKILELIDKYNIQIVEGPNFSGECFVYSLFKKTPLITRIHTPYIEVIKNFGWRLTPDRKLSCNLEDMLIERSDFITCSTNIYAQIMEKKSGVNSKIKVIPLGIEIPQLESTYYSHDTSKPLNVLFVGRLEKRKGIHVLMEAIPEVIDKLKYVEFTIVGRDTFFQRDETSFKSPERKNFKTEFYEKLSSEIKRKVHLVGEVSKEELENYYKNCDLFVAPSLHETFGFVYLEAMSYGKPVIGCKVGGVPEVIEDGRTGLLVEPENAQQLTEAILRILKDPKLRFEMGLNARERVSKKFSLENMVDKTEEIYSYLVSKI